MDMNETTNTTANNLIEAVTDSTVICLLTCGHYSQPMSEWSSSFDFPAEPHWCPTCSDERQFDPRLQDRLNWRRI
jgi:hypothetical protein